MLGHTAADCKRNVSLVLRFIKQLGFIINEQKCHLIPSTTFTYLGCVWNTDQWTVGLKPKREEMIRSSAADLLGKDSVSVRKVARFLGRVQSAIGILPLARARSRAVGFAFSAVCKSKEDYYKFFKLSQLAIEELQMWAELASGLTLPINTNGMSTVSVDTDATETGYGSWMALES